MQTLGKPAASLYADQTSHQWIVRDPDGNFWTMPGVDNPCEHRELVDPTIGELDLAPVPGHYKYMFDLPF